SRAWGVNCAWMTRAILLSPPRGAQDRLDLGQVGKEAFYGPHVGLYDALSPEIHRWSYYYTTSSDRRPGVFRVDVGVQGMIALHRQGTFREPGLELPDSCHTGEVESTENQRQRIAEGIDHAVVVFECPIAQLQGHHCLHSLLSGMLACHQCRGVSLGSEEK